MTEAEKQKLIAKMERKLKTMKNVTKRYRTVCASVWRPVDAYNDTRDEMIEAGLWSDWCKKHGYAFNHTAHDMFA